MDHIDKIRVLSSSLAKIVSDELGELYYLTNVIDERLDTICDNIIETIEIIIENNSTINISSDFIQLFLRSTIPTLTEILLKRCSKR